MTNKYRFISKIIGQAQFKKEISFLLDGFERTDYLSHLAIVSPKGSGKSLAARAIGGELSKITEAKHGCKKGFIEINCAELNKIDIFLTNLLPIITENKFCTLFLDELSFAGSSFVSALLTILNPNEKRVTEYFTSSGEKFVFDFRQLTIIAATTAPQDCHPDLLDRFRRCELSDYQISELGQIIQNKAKDVFIEDDVLLEAAATTRMSPRRAVLRADEIRSMGVERFGRKEWNQLKNALGIMPLGLSKIEIRYLQMLAKSPMTLTEAASRIGMTNAAIQQDIENYPRKCGLFRTVQSRGRMLTEDGRKVIKEIEENYA